MVDRIGCAATAERRDSTDRLRPKRPGQSRGPVGFAAVFSLGIIGSLVLLATQSRSNADLGVSHDFGATVAGRVDSSFDSESGVDGRIWPMLVQADDRILIGGDFQRIQRFPTQRVARFLPNGKLDPTLRTISGPDDIVYTLALQADGKILIGGRFTRVGSSPRKQIARLDPNGRLDTGFAPVGPSGNFILSVASMVDSKIVVAGDFTQFNGVDRMRIARLHGDGALDTDFDTSDGPDGVVRAVAEQSDGRLIVGGEFSKVGEHPRSRIARLMANGQLDQSFDSGMGANDTVRSILLQPNGQVLIGGHFTRIDGVVRKRLARLNSDGTLDPSFDTADGPNGPVRSFAVQPDEKVVIVGDFTAVAGVLRGRVARLHGDGSLDLSFDPGSGANLPWVISAGVQSDGKIIVVGDFTEFAGERQNRITRLHAHTTPPTLKVTTIPDNRVVISIFDLVRRYWEIQRSIDLSVWEPMESVILEQGKASVTDLKRDEDDRSFYRGEVKRPEIAGEMVWIAAGQFMMGGNEPDQTPVHQTIISNGFWMGKFEVTQLEFETVMGFNPSFFRTAGSTAPVESVSWNEANEYCRKLTEREREKGTISEELVYRLPTEAEWEYACRAGTQTVYSFGDDAANLDQYAWYGEYSGSTHQVGQKLPNRWGLHDMHGNVFEWCLDAFGEYSEETQIDPFYAAADEDQITVFRGGYFGSRSEPAQPGFWRRTLTSSFRGNALRNVGAHYRGFRIVLAAPIEESNQ